MQGCDRPPLNGGDEDLVRVRFVVFHKVLWSLLSWDRNERHLLVRGLKPDDFRPAPLAAAVSLGVLAVFILLGSLGWPKKPQSSREELTWNSINHCHNVPCIQRLLHIADFLLLSQQKRLALHFDIVVFLLRGSLLERSLPVQRLAG